MRLKRLTQTAAMLTLAGAVTTAQAASIPYLNVTVDGNLSEWGVTLLRTVGERETWRHEFGCAGCIVPGMYYPAERGLGMRRH